MHQNISLSTLREAINLGETFFTIPSNKYFYNKLYYFYLKKDWFNFWARIDNDKHLLFFLMIHNEFSDRDYWYYLGKVLNSGFNFTDFKDALLQLLFNPKRDPTLKKFMMTEFEQDYLTNLKSCKIYRGCNIDNRNGMRWTLDLIKALDSAAGNRGKNVVIEADFYKKDILAFFKTDSIIIINPNKVLNPEIIINLGIMEDHGARFRKDKYKELEMYIKNKPAYKKILSYSKQSKVY